MQCGDWNVELESVKPEFRSLMCHEALPVPVTSYRLPNRVVMVAIEGTFLFVLIRESISRAHFAEKHEWTPCVKDIITILLRLLRNTRR